MLLLSLCAQVKIFKDQTAEVVIKKWHSTKISLIYTSDCILTAIDQKKKTAVVLDMSKAFDSVNHDILVNKLQDIGLSSSAIPWFRSYLSNRYQAVYMYKFCSFQNPTNGLWCSPRKHPWAIAFYSLR